MALVANQPLRKVVSQHKVYVPGNRGQSPTIAILDCGHGKRIPPSELARSPAGIQCMLCPPTVKKPKPTKYVTAPGAPDNTQRVLVLLEKVVSDNAALRKKVAELEDAVTRPAKFELIGGTNSTPVGGDH
jgi:hypothetical protein